jgi:gluconolactonase
MALRDARATAVVDLLSREGTTLVNGQWRHPAAHHNDGVSQRYDITITIPQRVADFETRASTVLLEIVVHGVGQVWVNDGVVPVLGENGNSVITGYRARNRVVITRDARPGQRFDLSIRGMRSVLPNQRAEPFSIRSATVDFIATEATESIGVGRIKRLDPALDSIVAPGTRLQKVADGFQAIEGPVWMPEGYLLFSDFAANLIYRWSADDGVTIFRTKSGHAGFDIGSFGLPGANGLTVDRSGRLTIAEHGRRRIVRLEPNGHVSVLADAYEGRRLNSPNDLVYKSDGSLYFTDPPFGLPKSHASPRRELPYCGVFRWFRGQLQLLTAELGGPNGLAFSPDERYLYVAEWPPGNPGIVRYDVNDDGTLGKGFPFVPILADGLKVDQRGNLYATGGDATWVISPEGKPLGGIVPGGVSNLAWGDKDGRTLYLTYGSHWGSALYRVRVEVPGAGIWTNR